jgi:hypothetical protein
MTNEKQKPVTDQYRDNWDAIFDREMMSPQDKLANKILKQVQDHVAISAINHDTTVTVSAKLEF